MKTVFGRVNFKVAATAALCGAAIALSPDAAATPLKTSGAGCIEAQAGAVGAAGAPLVADGAAGAAGAPAGAGCVGGAPLVPGTVAPVTLTLKTASGNPIAPEDLIVTHTRPLHLLIIDPWLNDYQHVHPEPGARAGEWNFAFTPRREGKYRVFADFTPVVTARGLYASTDVQIGKSGLPASFTLVMKHEESWVVERDGYRFVLVPGVQPVRAKVSVDLKLVVTRADGKPVPMEPVMGAFAHLVAFDEARSGFAHLHPNEVNPLTPPDAVKPVLNFKIMIPAAGNYVIWSQLNLGGREVFVPFWFDVAP